MAGATQAMANDGARSVNCDRTPDLCVLMNYNLAVERVGDTQQVIDVFLAKMEQIAAETKAGKLTLQTHSYNMHHDAQSGAWSIRGSMYYALESKVAADAFRLEVEARGYNLEPEMEGEGC